MPAHKYRYLIIFFVVLALLLSAWLLRTRLSESVITGLMENAGLGGAVAHIQQLDHDRAYIADISVVLPVAGRSLSVAARGIDFTYQFDALLDGRIDKLSIDKIELTETETGQLQAEAGSTQSVKSRALLQMYKQALRKYVFFDQLVIHEIVFRGGGFGSLENKSLAVNSESADGVIHTSIDFLDAPHRVENTLTDALITIALIDAETGEQPAKIELSLDDDAVVGHYALRLAELSSWLQAFTPVGSLQGSATVSGELTIELKSDDVSLVTMSAVSNKFEYGAYSANQIEVNLKLRHSSDKQAHHIKLLKNSYVSTASVDTGAVSFDNVSIDIEGTLDMGERDWRYTGALALDRLNASYGAQRLSLGAVTTTVSADPETYQAAGSVRLESIPGSFEFEMQHQPEIGAGSLSLRQADPILLNEDQQRLSNLLAPWPYPFDVLAGSIRLDSNASWSKQAETGLTVSMKLEDVGGNLGEIIYSGLSFEHGLELMPSIESVAPSVLHISKLDSGVIASDISVKLAARLSKHGDLPELVARKLHGNIFKGEFSGDTLVYDMNLESNSLLLTVTGLDLAAIVETQQMETIQASGKLDGTLPVEIRAGNVFVNQGGLLNSRPGTIRYTPDAGTDQLRNNSQTDKVLDVLRDFRYSHLQAGVKYQPDGLLGVGLEMKGISPEFNANIPVNLNINTELNMINMLKGLRVTQGVSEGIEDKVRRKYEQNQTN